MSRVGNGLGNDRYCRAHLTPFEPEIVRPHDLFELLRHDRRLLGEVPGQTIEYFGRHIGPHGWVNGGSRNDIKPDHMSILLAGDGRRRGDDRIDPGDFVEREEDGFVSHELVPFAQDDSVELGLSVSRCRM
jgi:hypothetical protein